MRRSDGEEKWKKQNILIHSLSNVLCVEVCKITT